MRKKKRPKELPASPPSDDHLRGAVRGGTRAVLAAQIASQLISLGVLAILSRLIPPEDFGLLGMALPAVMLPRIVATLGVGMATVQRKELSPGQLTTLFWFNQLLGVAAAAVTALSGYVLARVYNQPAVWPISLALAGATLVVAAGNLHQSLIERDLRLGALSKARVLSQLAGGGAGIIVALNHGGVWSLVAQQIAELLMLTSSVWKVEPWRPSLPGRGERLAGLLTFSSYVSLSNLVFYISQNLDKLLFPWLLGSYAERAIGLYSQAMNLVMRIVYLFTATLSGVMLPALSRAQGNRPLYAELVARFFRLAAIGLFPCGVGLFVVAEEAMLLLGGEMWRDAGIILAALAPTILVQGFINLCGSILGSSGRPGRLLAGSIVICLLLVQGFLAAHFGVRYLYPAETPLDSAARSAFAMAVSFSLVSVVVLYVPYLKFSLASAQVTFTEAFRPATPALRSALVMGLAIWLLRQLLLAAPELPSTVRLAILIAAGAGVYSLLAWKDLRWFWEELVETNKEQR